MSKLTIIVACTVTVFVVWLAYGCDARRIHLEDLEVAASDKHERKKGAESDYHESDFAKHGKKDEKGYEKKHGYVSIIYQFFSSPFFCSLSFFFFSPFPFFFCVYVLAAKENGLKFESVEIERRET